VPKANQETPLYFVDGSQPTYNAHPAHGWMRKGKTLELRSNHGRTNINGALNWLNQSSVRPGLRSPSGSTVHGRLCPAQDIACWPILFTLTGERIKI
jgi:hypothetical protein